MGKLQGLLLLPPRRSLRYSLFFFFPFFCFSITVTHWLSQGVIHLCQLHPFPQHRAEVLKRQGLGTSAIYLLLRYRILLCRAPDLPSPPPDGWLCDVEER